jgi:signal transduction histidine kinase
MASELLLAEERERKQLAQDLHDSIGQALFLLRRKLDQEPVSESASAEIDVMLGEIGKVVSTLTFELSPRVLHELGLRPAIRGLSLDMKQRFGLIVTVDDDRRAIPLEERSALVLFRSLREILINVAKHSETNSARVTIQRVDLTLQITVEDRGKGFDLTSLGQVDAGRFGLFSVRERLEYLGGSLRIQSRPGAGTTVTLTLPLAV